MKKTITLTLLGLASAFALTTANAKAVETPTDIKEAETTTNMKSNGAGIQITTTTGSLQFEDFTINTKNAIQQIASKNALNINVTDLRGTREGCHVTAHHSGLQAENQSDELENATISLADGGLSNNVEGTNALVLNTATPISIGKDSVLISEAAVGNGMGSWDHNWNAGDVKLNIPAKEARDMYEDTYTTIINWTLAAGPQAE